MNDQRLLELIQSADETTPLPAIDAGLAGRVRRRVRNRARARSAGAASVVAGVVLAVVIWNTWHVGTKKTQLSRHQEAGSDLHAARRQQVADHAELAQLQEEAELHDRIASAMIQASARPARHPQANNDVLAALNIAASLAENRDRAAHTMLNRGDDLLSESKSPAQAAIAYRRVLELFPQAPQAETARTRLRRLGA